MNQNSRGRGEQGFTMIELMTVIAIMAILAGILIASLPGIQARMNRQKVETLMAELESGLSHYQLDNGIYPQNPVSANRDTCGSEGAAILYRHLSGDWGGEDGSGEPDGIVDENAEVYVQRLSYDENRDSKDPRSDRISGEYIVVDAYGNRMRYLAEAPNLSPEQRQTYNPTFDLWSIVDADPDDPDDQARHITNWQSK